MNKHHKQRPPLEDGIHWEEWRNGQLFASGHHNGSTIDGKDATYNQETCEIEIRDFIAKWMSDNGDWYFDIPLNATAAELLREIARQSDDRGAGNAMTGQY